MDKKEARETTLLDYGMLFCIGGLSYGLIEILYRGYTHISMIVLGGICFVCCGALNEHALTWEMPMPLQMFICSLMITALEYICGTIVNVWLGWNVWDYSNMPFNLDGQICLPFSIIWFFLSFVAIVVDDYLRYMFMDGKKPTYRWK